MVSPLEECRLKMNKGLVLTLESWVILMHLLIIFPSVDISSAFYLHLHLHMLTRHPFVLSAFINNYSMTDLLNNWTVSLQRVQTNLFTPSLTHHWDTHEKEKHRLKDEFNCKSISAAVNWDLSGHCAIFFIQSSFPEFSSNSLFL